jgi:hypothetical protein
VGGSSSSLLPRVIFMEVPSLQFVPVLLESGRQFAEQLRGYRMRIRSVLIVFASRELASSVTWINPLKSTLQAKFQSYLSPE